MYIVHCTTGHSFEWCKLVLMIERLHTAGPVEGQEGTAPAAATATEWMLPAAELIFRTAVECGWDHGSGGVYCKSGLLLCSPAVSLTPLLSMARAAGCTDMAPRITQTLSIPRAKSSTQTSTCSMPRSLWLVL